ncbi:MAG: 5'-3' exonuclease H3TH domain-containing protein, partial [Planctomycetota bacterium]
MSEALQEKDLFDAAEEATPKKPRLYLLDGMALFYRAHFAMVRSHRYTSGGVCTSGIFGMTGAVFDLIKRENPTHMAVAFDTEHPTERHRIFPEYKAQRDAMPEDMAAQKPLLDRLFQAMKIPILRNPGYEADDVIGTLAGQADAAGFETWMVTPDKDYHQLVTSSVKIYKPGRKGGEVELIGVPEVLERWQIERVDQVLDILGLMGDASDNIPGISGIGEKTAQKLIAKYNTIENLIEHASELKGKQRERVEQNSEMALLSKRLVRIQTDVPHEYDLSSFSIGDPVTDELKSLFMELEFDTLGKRYFGKTFSSATQRANVVREKREAEIQTSLFDEPAEEQTIDDVNVQYEIVKTAAQRKKLITQLLKQSEVCFDTETTGLDARTARPIGLAFSFEARRGHYVVVPEEPDKAQAVIAEFEPFWSADNI